MKKILFRKLLLDYLSFFAVTLFSTSAVIWVFQAVNFLDIMIEDGRDYLIYINYSILNFPKIFSKIYPFALFFSLFYVITKYELNNELIIYWNIGINKFEVVNFILKFSIVLFLFQIFLTSLVVPKAQDLARSFIRTSTVNFFGNFIKPQKFNDTIKGVTIYSEGKDNNGDLNNIYLKKEIDLDNFQVTYAKKGIFKEINNTPILVLYDGETITAKKGEITNISFSKSDFTLKSLKSNTTTYKKTQELSTINILRCINFIYKFNFYENKGQKLKVENCTLKNTGNILKEFYKRLIIPLYIPILTLIPLLLIISSKENINYLKFRIFVFLLGLVFIIFSETTIRFISEILLENIKIIIIPFIFILILYSVFFFKFNIKK